MFHTQNKSTHTYIRGKNASRSQISRNSVPSHYHLTQRGTRCILQDLFVPKRKSVSCKKHKLSMKMCLGEFGPSMKEKVLLSWTSISAVQCTSNLICLFVVFLSFFLKILAVYAHNGCTWQDMLQLFSLHF